MPKQCTICAHPKRQEIETAIAKSVPLRKIVEQFGGSVGSVDRHAKNCVGRALKQLREGRQELLDTKQAVSVEAFRETVSEQARNGTLLTAVTVEKELARCFERLNKLFDACDYFLTNPELPGEYLLDARASEIRIVWEELEDESLVEDGAKPKWIRKTGSLQEALALAFSNGHRRLVKTNPIKFSDPRELILKTTAQLSAQIDLLAKLEGRYRPVEKELGEGNAIQLNTVINILNLFSNAK